MNISSPILDAASPISIGARASARFIGADPAARRGLKRCERRAPDAFTLVEVMIVMVLLSFIVFALMGVFSSTQSAFRASITQTDVLESGRAAMDLITGDLRAMTPSGGTNFGTVNFYLNASPNSVPLVQSLIASPGSSRTNVQQALFILSQNNLNGVPTWYGTGYAVLLTPTNTYSLYRFSTNSPVAQTGAAYNLFYAGFVNFYNSPASYSHLMDGVVGFRIHAFDVNGMQINYSLTNAIQTNAVVPSQPGEIGYVFYSNAIPAAVEIELSTLEDRTLQRAESRPSGAARTQYLQQQANNLHVFRQRVAIPNVDPSVYQ